MRCSCVLWCGCGQIRRRFICVRTIAALVGCVYVCTTLVQVMIMTSKCANYCCTTPPLLMLFSTSKKLKKSLKRIHSKFFQPTAQPPHYNTKPLPNRGRVVQQSFIQNLYLEARGLFTNFTTPIAKARTNSIGTGLSSI